MQGTLLWCYEGTTTVNAPDRVMTVIEGDLVIAPHGALYSPGATICEMEFADFPDLSGTTRIHLGARWSERMVAEYARTLCGVDTMSEDVRRLLDAPIEAPALPRSAAARHVAQQLVARPASAASLADFARELGVSTRTIQRQFSAETGLVFSEWRAALRVYVAHTLLLGGMTTAEASELVGFGASSSLTRAFRRHTGATPRSRTRAGAEPGTLPGMLVHARPDADLVLWVARGTATVTTGEYCRFVGQGETITLPSGTDVRVDVAAGSLAIPVPLEECESIESIYDALRASRGTFAARGALEWV